MAAEHAEAVYRHDGARRAPDVTSQTISGLMTHWAITIAGLLAPVLAAAAAAGVAANVIQNKPGFTPERDPPRLQARSRRSAASSGWSARRR